MTVEVATMRNVSHPRCRQGVVALTLLLAGVSAARAEITAITADLEANVTERVTDLAGSSDRSVESFPDTSPTLPVTALAGLGNFAGAVEPDHGGRGEASFANPALSENPNPEELGVEALAFAKSAGIAYAGSAEVVETRTVVFSPDELGVDQAGESNLVFSTAFLDGAVVLWTDNAAADLTGAGADCAFTVTQDTSTGGELVVFEAELQLTGEPDGEVRLTASSILQAQLGGPELLAGLADSATQAALADLDAAGRVHIVLLPAQSVDYAYFASADEAFTLRAAASCAVDNGGGGNGVGAVFGRPFASLASAFDPFLPQAKGGEVQAALNRAIQAGLERPDTQDPGPGPCGVFGGEVALLAALGFGGMRRWR
jgi:hypothetical protein